MIPDALLWALWDAPVANVEEWAVLVCMAGRADADGCSTYQANETIAEATRLSPDTVKRRQRTMRERGLIALGNQAAATEYRAGHRPTVYDLQVPYEWFGSSIARVNRERAKRGRQPLTPEDRPPLADAPARRVRKDFGVPRPKAGAQAAADADPDNPDEGGLQAPPPREGYKHPHPTPDDAPEATDEGARGGAREGATSTPTYKEDLLSFGEDQNPSRPAPAAPDAETPTETDPKPEVPRPDVDALCALLADLIAGNGSKRPTITKTWRAECRRMLDIDQRDPAKAEALIRWCQADPFWRSNVLSMPTFRAKYDQLRLKALAEWEEQQAPGRGQRAAGGGIAQRNSHFQTPGATFGMPGQPDEETPR